MKRSHNSNAHSEGIALLLTLLFVVLLTALVVEFAYETQVHTSQVTANLQDFDALIAARSAVNSGMSILVTDLLQNQQGVQQNGKQSTLSPAQSKTSKSNPKVPGMQYDSLDEQWAQGTPFQQINEAVMQCDISDEYGKLNLNSLINTRSQTERPGPVEILKRLLQDRGAEPDVVDAVLDWLDADDEQRASGAESDYYQSLPLPYHAKNGPMSSVEELLMVRGITPDIYFGDPSKDQVPLSELLTVYGQRSGRINVNTAQRELLVAMGEAVGQDSIADAIIKERENAPFTSVEDIGSRGIQLTGTSDPASQRPFVVSSGAFRVQGNGMSGDCRVRIEAFVRRDIQGGPDGFRLLNWQEIR